MIMEELIFLCFLVKMQKRKRKMVATAVEIKETVGTAREEKKDDLSDMIEAGTTDQDLKKGADMVAVADEIIETVGIDQTEAKEASETNSAPNTPTRAEDAPEDNFLFDFYLEY